ncbi:hypothetical protein EBB79_08435 [Parasedimentitalea marina]|uniref:Acyl-homoserine-lactone synthase n=1 Tax=Parasedimentitalea marina TaxID=2483033 RepID=A0A3T0N1L5_9RHOB|nr:acyl-homoserine-lactone synthase [Parasedimentitalea marina]AZV77918.1 hypothetical protein EBB79_08435 [Parasedimentitalea marina]
MRLHTFSFLDQYHHGSIFSDYLALRYRALVRKLGWDLSHDGSVEMDQYDHPGAVFSVVTYQGKVIGGARALPCSASWGGWSYMLKDASLGKLGRIPNDLLSEYPNAGHTWEGTRLVMDETVESAQVRLMAIRLVVFGLCKLASKGGAETIISLSPSPFGRLLGVMGYTAVPIGREYIGEEDSLSYRAFSMPCNPLINADVCAGLEVISARSEQLFIPGGEVTYLQRV